MNFAEGGILAYAGWGRGMVLWRGDQLGHGGKSSFSCVLSLESAHFDAAKVSIAGQPVFFRLLTLSSRVASLQPADYNPLSNSRLRIQYVMLDTHSDIQEGNL